MSEKMIPWIKEEGLFVASPINHVLKKIKWAYDVKFYPKRICRKLSELSDEDFEKSWEELKQAGGVREMMVKYDEEGNLIRVL
jgi:hypothetical protein